MKTFRGLILGAGRGGEVLNLRPMQDAGAEIVGVIDINESLAKKVAKRNNVENYYTSFKEAVKETKPDFIVIATPQQLHYQNCKDALKAGLHVLVEKPYTETLVQAKELEELAAKKKQKICVVHNFKFVSGLMEAKRIYDAGKIGKVLHINRVWMINGNVDRMIKNKGFWAHNLVGGKWAEVIPHALYTPFQYLDPADAELISVNVTPPSKKWSHLSVDEASIVIKAKSVYIHIFFTANVDKKVRYINDMTIYGSKGVIFANYGSARLVEGVNEAHKLVYSAKKSLSFTAKKAKWKAGKKDPRGYSTGHYLQAVQFLKFIANKGKSPVSQNEAYHTMRLSEEVSEAIQREVEKF